MFHNFPPCAWNRLGGVVLMPCLAHTVWLSGWAGLCWCLVCYKAFVGRNLRCKRWIIGILGFRLGKSFWLHITGWPHCCFATFRYSRRLLLQYTCDIQWSLVRGERCRTHVGTKAKTFWYVSRMSIVTFPVLNCDDRAPIWRVDKTRNGSWNQATLCPSDQWIGFCWRYIGGGFLSLSLSSVRVRDYGPTKDTGWQHYYTWLQTKVGSAKLYVKSLRSEPQGNFTCNMPPFLIAEKFSRKICQGVKKKRCHPNVLMDGHVSFEAYKRNSTPSSSKDSRKRI